MGPSSLCYQQNKPPSWLAPWAEMPSLGKAAGAEGASHSWEGCTWLRLRCCCA